MPLLMDPVTGQILNADRLRSIAYAAAVQNGIPPAVFMAMIERESGFDPQAYNATSGATGIGQALRSTAAQPGFGVQPWDPDDPFSALQGSAQYLTAMRTYFQTNYGNADWQTAVAAYNAGPGNIERALQNGTPLEQVTDPGHLAAIFGPSAGGNAGAVLPTGSTPEVNEPRDTPPFDAGAGGNVGWKPPAGWSIADYDIFGNQVQVAIRDDNDPTGKTLKRVTIPLAQWEGFTGVKVNPATGKPYTPKESAESVSPNTALQVGAQQSTAAAQLAQGARQFDLSTAEGRRQYDLSRGDNNRWKQEDFDFEKAKFNATHSFNEAIQKWREATDSRDFKAAEFWKNRADEFSVRRDQLERMTFAERQREFEYSAATDNANRDLKRGETLLNLGSRPETLGRYLYALQGQQTPQGMDFGTKALPGFGPNASNPIPAPRETIPAMAPANAASTAPVIPTVAGGTGGGGGGPPPVVPPPPVVTAPPKGILDLTRTSFDNPLTAGSNEFAAPTTAAPLTGTANIDPKAVLAAGVGGQAISLSDWALKNLTAGGYKFADGGVIPEPVIGQGTQSGLPYLFGEDGPETVVPKGKTLASVKGKRGAMTGAFATGGVMGYDPKRLTQSVFNPMGLQSYLSGEYLRPGIPNFPQYQAFTGGSSLLPSAQALSRSLPSERGLYRGFLRDEAGVDPDDALAMAGRMAPRSGQLRTPRYAG